VLMTLALLLSTRLAQHGTTLEQDG